MTAFLYQGKKYLLLHTLETGVGLTATLTLTADQHLFLHLLSQQLV